ncbi:MAG: E3 binding domain-containing protein, partial [Opitutaceae bacterium]|nr:E3 binding domain-containing protein [Opitutaceae bacterium]
MAQIIEMPKLSDTMTVGTLVKWLKNEGDAVKNGTMLAEVETDKATMELECFFDGTLLKIFAPAGSQVEIGAPLCAIGKPGEKVEVPAGKAPVKAEASAAVGSSVPAAETKAAAPAAAAPREAATVAPAVSSPQDSPVAAAASTSAPSEGHRIRISPLARKLAAEKGINPSSVTGSGPGGRIVRTDILAAEKSGSAKGGSGAGTRSGATLVSTLSAKGPI